MNLSLDLIIEALTDLQQKWANPPPGEEEDAEGTYVCLLHDPKNHLGLTWYVAPVGCGGGTEYGREWIPGATGEFDAAAVALRLMAAAKAPALDSDLDRIVNDIFTRHAEAFRRLAQ